MSSAQWIAACVSISLLSHFTSLHFILFHGVGVTAYVLLCRAGKRIRDVARPVDERFCTALEAVFTAAASVAVAIAVTQRIPPRRPVPLTGHWSAPVVTGQGRWRRITP